MEWWKNGEVDGWNDGMMDGWNNGFKSVTIKIVGIYLIDSPIFQHSSIPIFHGSGKKGNCS